MNKQPLLIQDAYDFGPPPPKSREAPWEKLYRFFFGDDVFISYSRADAIRYVPSLAARLAAKKHICFFDQLAAEPNAELPERLKKKILRSTVFVLVGTKGAVSSSFVRKEVELFRRTRRPFIPVDVDGALVEQEGWRDVVGVAKIREEGARVREGDPSPEVIDLIKDSFRYTRRSQWLRGSLLAGVSVILITAAASLLLIRAAQAKISAAEAEAAAIKRQADAEVDASAKKVSEAQQRLESATANAADAQKRADDAAAAEKVASTRREAAEHARRQAQELERQSAERAADMSRREAGSRAALLSREPGMEADALALALGAAEQSFSQQGSLPEQVLNGLVASASATDYSLPLEGLGRLPYLSMKVSPNGEKVFAAFRDPNAYSDRQVLWDVRTGRHTPLTPGMYRGSIASFSRDGRRLAVSGSLRTTHVSLWDLTGPGPKLLATGCGRGPGLSEVALDDDGSHVAFSKGSGKPGLVICEIATGREEVLETSSPLIEGRVERGLAFTADDELAVYAVIRGRDFNVQRKVLFFPRTGGVVMLKTPGGWEDERFDGFGDDGSIIILKSRLKPGGGLEFPDRVYIQSPAGALSKLSGYRGDIYSASFSGGRARVVTLSGGQVRLADSYHSPSFAALRGHLHQLSAVAFSPGGETVLTLGGDATARLWDVRTGGLRHTLALSNESSDASQPGGRLFNIRAAFLPDGSRLTTINSKGEIQVWDVSTGRPVCPGTGRVLYGMSASVYDVSFTAGGEYVMAYDVLRFNERGLITFMNARTCQPAGFFDLDKGNSFLSFSADGTGILTISSAPGGWELKFWSLRGAELRDGAPVRLSPSSLGRYPDHFMGVSAAAGGAPVLAKTMDGAMRVWKRGAATGVQLEGLRIPGYHYPFAISANGTRAATVMGTEARVWDMRSGKLLMAFPCEADMSVGQPLALSPDGSKLLIAGRDHTARIYPTSPEGFLVAARRLLGR